MFISISEPSSLGGSQGHNVSTVSSVPIDVLSSKISSRLVSLSTLLNLVTNLICLPWRSRHLLSSRFLDSRHCHQFFSVNTDSITISQDASIQVQSVYYQSQTGHDPHGYNTMSNQRLYTGCDLIIYRCQYRN